MAREFWRRYAKSPEVVEPLDAAKIDHLAGRIVPYITNRYARVDQPEWTVQARDYVERALSGGLTLSTLLAGVSAETEAAFVAMRHKVADEAQQIAFKEKVTLTPGMMEGFAAAKVTVKALRDAGGSPTRESVTRALESMRSFDLGDLVIGFSPTDHTGLEMTDLSMISAKGFLR